MRKLVVVLAVALVAVPVALAKERNVELIGIPASATAGKAFTAKISITRDRRPDAGRAPTVRLINQSVSSTGSNVINITARSTGVTGVYRARVVFPSAGTWRVLVIDSMTQRAYPFGRIAVHK
jgi:hypothetical protein